VDLDRLIATEQRLDEKIRRAREEAAHLVEEAQAAARAREAEVAAELAAATQRFATETAAERERRVQKVQEEAVARVRRFDGVSAANVSRAARDVVTRLVGGEEPAA
jgi:vacuolar-type H+-ATPase subunit H